MTATNITTDAVVPTIPNRPHLTISQVKDIETNLDFYEMVSLVYLLYDDPHIALQKLLIEMKGGTRNSLSDWAIIEDMKKNDWNNKLQEALCIIQNYKILKLLGHNKEDLIMHFYPHLPSITQSVKKIKKQLYKIFDNLSKEETDKIISLVKEDFGKQGKCFENYDPSLLEIYLLHWLSEKYISENNLSNLIKIFKQMELFEIADTLKNYSCNSVDERKPDIQTEVKPINNELELQEEIKLLCMKSKKNNKVCDNYEVLNKDESMTSAISLPSNQDSFAGIVSDSRYYIDKENPGIVLIINQTHFHTEPRREYKHLLPNTTDKLEDRFGSQVDCDALKETFEFLEFEVVIKSNLTHIELETEVKSFLENVTKQSSVFICILSHGEEGVVYGFNSCRVEVQSIIELMGSVNKKHLDNKPKVLLLQACQGREIQTVDDYEKEHITTDGGHHKKIMSLTKDMLIFWATVPKFAAIRDMKAGTWFIQSLCKKIKQHYKELHFLDICTRVENDISNKTWKDHNRVYGMTPYRTVTFNKDLYFPQK